MLTQQQILAQTGLYATELQAGINATRQARLQANARYSGFLVGAALLAHEGAIFTGSNWETAADNGMCAEGTALGTMRHTACPPEDIRAVFVVGAPKDSDAAIECTPCGGCRDRLVEYLSPDTAIITIDVEGNVFGVYKLQELHPTYFATRISAQELDMDEADGALDRVYAPYHPAAQSQIVIEYHVIGSAENNMIDAGHVQNASYTLKTDAAGILQHQFFGLNEPYKIGHVIITLGPGAKSSAATLQRLREFCPLSTKILFSEIDQSILWSGTLDQALPHSFGPDNLAPQNVVLPDRPPQP